MGAPLLGVGDVEAGADSGGRCDDNVPDGEEVDDDQARGTGTEAEDDGFEGVPHGVGFRCF